MFTTSTFHIAFLYTSMYSYRLQYLRQLDKSIRLHSNNTFCTRFRKDFHFWFWYGVPLLVLLDKCKNLLPLIIKLQQLLQFLSHTCLSSLEKGYVKMKHVNYYLYQNTNTVILIETNFYRHNQEHFLFLLQKHDFSATWEVPWVWQSRVFLEHSPCLLLHPTQWGFQLIHRPSINRICPTVNSPSWTLCLRDRRLDSC